MSLSKTFDTAVFIIAVLMFILGYFNYPIEIEGDLLRWIGELKLIREDSVPYHDLSLQYPPLAYYTLNLLTSFFGFKGALLVMNVILGLEIVLIMFLQKLNKSSIITVLLLLYLLTMNSESTRFFSIQWYTPSVLLGLILLFAITTVVMYFKEDSLVVGFILSILVGMQFFVKPEFFLASFLLFFLYLIGIIRVSVKRLLTLIGIIFIIVYCLIHFNILEFSLKGYMGYGIFSSFVCDFYKNSFQDLVIGSLVFLFLIYPKSSQNSQIHLLGFLILVIFFGPSALHYFILFYITSELIKVKFFIREMIRIETIIALAFLVLDLRSYLFFNHYSQSVFVELIVVVFYFKDDIAQFSRWSSRALLLMVVVIISNSSSASTIFVKAIGQPLTVELEVKRELEDILHVIEDGKVLSVSYGLDFESLRGQNSLTWLTQWVRLHDEEHADLVLGQIVNSCPDFVVMKRRRDCLNSDSRLILNSTGFNEILEHYDEHYRSKNYLILKKRFKL